MLDPPSRKPARSTQLNSAASLLGGPSSSQPQACSVLPSLTLRVCRRVELVTPPPGAAVGERVTCAVCVNPTQVYVNSTQVYVNSTQGFAGEPDEQLKKKVFEGVQPDLASTVDCVAAYKGVPFITSAGACTVASVALGHIK